MQFFAIFPTDLKSAYYFAFFDTHFVFFQKYFFGALFVHFRNFGAKLAPYGAKY